jgi:hypothetical protein
MSRNRRGKLAALLLMGDLGDPMRDTRHEGAFVLAFLLIGYCFLLADRDIL